MAALANFVVERVNELRRGAPGIGDQNVAKKDLGALIRDLPPEALATILSFWPGDAMVDILDSCVRNAVDESLLQLCRSLARTGLTSASLKSLFALIADQRAQARLLVHQLVISVLESAANATRNSPPSFWLCPGAASAADRGSCLEAYVNTWPFGREYGIWALVRVSNFSFSSGGAQRNLPTAAAGDDGSGCGATTLIQASNAAGCRWQVWLQQGAVNVTVVDAPPEKPATAGSVAANVGGFFGKALSQAAGIGNGSFSSGSELKQSVGAETYTVTAESTALSPGRWVAVYVHHVHKKAMLGLGPGSSELTVFVDGVQVVKSSSAPFPRGMGSAPMTTLRVADNLDGQLGPIYLFKEGAGVLSLKQQKELMSSASGDAACVVPRCALAGQAAARAAEEMRLSDADCGPFGPGLWAAYHPQCSAWQTPSGWPVSVPPAQHSPVHANANLRTTCLSLNMAAGNGSTVTLSGVGGCMPSSLPDARYAVLSVGGAQALLPLLDALVQSAVTGPQQGLERARAGALVPAWIRAVSALLAGGGPLSCALARSMLQQEFIAHVASACARILGTQGQGQALEQTQIGLVPALFSLAQASCCSPILQAQVWRQLIFWLPMWAEALPSVQMAHFQSMRKCVRARPAAFRLESGVAFLGLQGLCDAIGVWYASLCDRAIVSPPMRRSLVREAASLLACMVGAGDIGDRPTGAVWEYGEAQGQSAVSNGSVAEEAEDGDRPSLWSPCSAQSEESGGWADNTLDGEGGGALTSVEAEALLALLVTPLHAHKAREGEEAREDLSAAVLSLLVGMLDYDCSHVHVSNEQAQVLAQDGVADQADVRSLVTSRLFGARAALDTACGGDGQLMPFLLFGVLPACTGEYMRCACVRAVLHAHRALLSRERDISDTLVSAATAVGRTVGKTLLRVVGAAREVGAEFSDPSGKPALVPLRFAAAIGKVASTRLGGAVTPTSEEGGAGLTRGAGTGAPCRSAVPGDLASSPYFGAFWARSFTRSFGWDVLFHVLSYVRSPVDDSMALRRPMSAHMYTALWEGVLLPDPLDLLLRVPTAACAGAGGMGQAGERVGSMGTAGPSADEAVTPSYGPSQGRAAVGGWTGTDQTLGGFTEDGRALAILAVTEHVRDRTSAGGTTVGLDGAWVQDWRDPQVPSPLRPVLCAPGALLLLLRLLPALPAALALRAVLDVSHLCGTAVGGAEEDGRRGGGSVGRLGRPGPVFLARCPGWELRLATYLLGFNGTLRPIPCALPVHAEVDGVSSAGGAQAPAAAPRHDSDPDGAVWDSVYAAGERLLRGLLRHAMAEPGGWKPFQRLLSLLPLAAIAGTPAAMSDPSEYTPGPSIAVFNPWQQEAESLPIAQKHGARMLAWMFAGCFDDFDARRTRAITRANVDNLTHLTALVEPYVCIAGSEGRESWTACYAFAVLQRVQAMWDRVLFSGTDDQAERTLSAPTIGSSFSLSGDLRSTLLSFTWDTLQAFPVHHSECVRCLGRIGVLLKGLLPRTGSSTSLPNALPGDEGDWEGEEAAGLKAVDKGKEEGGASRAAPPRPAGRPGLSPDASVYHALLHLHSFLTRARAQVETAFGAAESVHDPSAQLMLDRTEATAKLAVMALTELLTGAPATTSSAHVSVSRFRDFLEGYQLQIAKQASLRTAVLDAAGGSNLGLQEQEEGALKARHTWAWLLRPSDSASDWLTDPGWTPLVGAATGDVSTCTRLALNGVSARVRRTQTALLHLLRSDAQPVASLLDIAVQGSPLARQEGGAWVMVDRGGTCGGTEQDRAKGSAGRDKGESVGVQSVFGGFGERLRRGGAKMVELFQNMALAIEADTEAEAVLDALEGGTAAGKGVGVVDGGTEVAGDDCSPLTLAETGAACSLLLPSLPTGADMPAPLPCTNPRWFVGTWAAAQGRSRAVHSKRVTESINRSSMDSIRRADTAHVLQAAGEQSTRQLHAPGGAWGAAPSPAHLVVPGRQARLSGYSDAWNRRQRIEVNPRLVDYAPAAYERVNDRHNQSSASNAAQAISAAAGEGEGAHSAATPPVSNNGDGELEASHPVIVVPDDLCGAGVAGLVRLPPLDEEGGEGEVEGNSEGNSGAEGTGPGPHRRGYTGVTPTGSTSTAPSSSCFAVHEGEDVHLAVPAMWITADRVAHGVLRLTTTHIIWDPKTPPKDAGEGLKIYGEMDSEMEGEVKDKEKADTRLPPPRPQRWRIALLCRVLPRRYLLKRCGLEFFFTEGSAALFAFPGHGRTREGVGKVSADVADALWKCSADGRAPHLFAALSRGDAQRSLVPSQLARNCRAQAAWLSHDLSTYEYLMELNYLAGRSFNDLTQYPIFPWVISDYTSERLDLSDSRVYRDLSKPMGALNEDRLAVYKERMEGMSSPNAQATASGRPGRPSTGGQNALGSLFATLAGTTRSRAGPGSGGGMDPGAVPPFLYGSHYSNAGSVLFYLMRLEPFTRAAVELQSGRFDVPDRLLHSVSACWNGVTHAMSDVKELVPQWYTTPEMFLNTSDLPLGTSQSGEEVGSVRLPPWAQGSPHDFVWLNRLALESDAVSAKIHHWIDLVFGCKQRGPAALEANNLFYYLTYEDQVDLDALGVGDPILKAALEAQVANFGQTPSQLFTKSHPARLKREPTPGADGAISAVATTVPLPLFGFTVPLRQYKGPFPVPVSTQAPVWYTGLFGSLSALPHGAEAGGPLVRGSLPLLEVADTLRVYTAATHPGNAEHAARIAALRDQANAASASSEDFANESRRSEIDPSWAVVQPFDLQVSRAAAHLYAACVLLSSASIPGTASTSSRLASLHADGTLYLHRWSGSHPADGLPFFLRMDGKGRAMVRVGAPGTAGDVDVPVRPLPLVMHGQMSGGCGGLSCASLMELLVRHTLLIPPRQGQERPLLGPGRSASMCVWAVPVQAHSARAALLSPRPSIDDTLISIGAGGGVGGSTGSGGSGAGANGSGGAPTTAPQSEMLLLFTAGYADGGLRWQVTAAGSSSGASPPARTRADAWIPRVHGAWAADVTAVAGACEAKASSGPDSTGLLLTGHLDGRAVLWRVVWNTPADACAACAVGEGVVPPHARSHPCAFIARASLDGLHVGPPGSAGAHACGSMDASVILPSEVLTRVGGRARHGRGGAGGQEAGQSTGTVLPDPSTSPALLVRIAELGSASNTTQAQQPSYAAHATPAAPVTAVAASAALGVALVGRLDGSVSSYDSCTGRPLRAWDVGKDSVGVHNALASAGFIMCGDAGAAVPVQHIAPVSATGHIIVHWLARAVPMLMPDVPGRAKLNPSPLPVSVLACLYCNGDVLAVHVVVEADGTEVRGLPTWVTALAVSASGTALLVGTSTGSVHVRHPLTLECGGHMAMHTPLAEEQDEEERAKPSGAASALHAGAPSSPGTSDSLASSLSGRFATVQKAGAAAASRVAAAAARKDPRGILNAAVAAVSSAAGSSSGQGRGAAAAVPLEPELVFPAAAVTCLHLPDKETTLLAGCADGRIVCVADGSRGRRDLATAILANFV